MKIELDLTKIVDCEVDGINHSDAPDYVDAYITEAWLPITLAEFAPGCVQNKQNGDCFRPLNDAELDWLNEQSGFVYEQVQKFLH